MAARSLQLFLNQIAGAPTQFKLRLLQVVFDVLMVHESDFLSTGSGDNVSPERFESAKFGLIVLLTQSNNIVEYLLTVLKADENAEIHACVCIGLAKLLLSGMITNEGVCPPASTFLASWGANLCSFRHSKRSFCYMSPQKPATI
jgi:condensin complex subunit 3